MKNLKHNERGFGLLLPLIIVTVLAVVALIAWAVYSKQTTNNQTNNSTAKGDVLMIVRYAGGLCPNNQVCSTDHKIYDDGTFENHTKLSVTEVDQLKDTISTTDFLRYQDNPEPACESFHDGTDEILVFPQKYSDKTFTLCQLQIPANDPAISFINKLVQSHEIR